MEAFARIGCWSAVALLAGLSGCASESIVETYAYNGAPDVRVPVDSVPYYLPKQLIAIDIERAREASPAPDKPKGDSGKKQAVSSATPPVPSISAGDKPSDSKPDDKPANKPAEKPGSGGDGLPAAQHRAEEGIKDTITIRLLSPVPDTTQRYYAHLDHSNVRDDDYTIQTTESGLLTTTSATSTDQSGQFLGKLVALVTEVKKLGIKAEALGPEEPGPVCGPVEGLPLTKLTTAKEFKTTLIVDPTVDADLERARKQLCSLGAYYQIARFKVDPSVAPVAANTGVTTPTRTLGLFHRRAEPYVLSVYAYDPKKVDAAGSPTAYEFVNAVALSVPNRAPVERITLPVDSGVTTEQSVKFTNGMLVESVANRPSSLVGIASIPVDLLKAIVSIPSALFQFKVTSTSAETDLIKAQTEQIKEQTNQLEAIEKLKAAEEGDEEEDAGTDAP